MMGRQGKGLVERWRKAVMDPAEEEETGGAVPSLGDRREQE